jgi:hypothetical protein
MSNHPLLGGASVRLRLGKACAPPVGAGDLRAGGERRHLARKVLGERAADGLRPGEALLLDAMRARS